MILKDSFLTLGINSHLGGLLQKYWVLFLIYGVKVCVFSALTDGRLRLWVYGVTAVGFILILFAITVSFLLWYVSLFLWMSQMFYLRDIVKSGKCLPEGQRCLGSHQAGDYIRGCLLPGDWFTPGTKVNVR